MNSYKKAMTALPFDPEFSQKTVRLLSAHHGTASRRAAHRACRAYGRVALIATALALMVTTVSFAALHLLSPSEVAEYFGDTALAAAFDSRDAVIVNEEQTVNEYTITFNGVVSGKHVGDYVENTDSAYAVLSVRYTDGRAFSVGETWEEDPIARFTVSPYVYGKAPSEVNLFSLESRTHKGVIENVMYILIETDKLGQFGVENWYFGVAQSDTMALFVNDEKSPFALDTDGKITLKAERDESVACALFRMPQ